MIGDALPPLLSGLLSGGVFEGAAVVRRDGLPVTGRFRRNISQETWAAMSAAMLGAAEAAFEEWGAGPPTFAVIDGRDTRMAILGLDDDTLLVVVGPAEDALTAFVAAAQDGQARLALALKQI